MFSLFNISPLQWYASLLSICSQLNFIRHMANSIEQKKSTHFFLRLFFLKILSNSLATAAFDLSLFLFKKIIKFSSVCFFFSSFRSDFFLNSCFFNDSVFIRLLLLFLRCRRFLSLFFCSYTHLSPLYFIRLFSNSCSNFIPLFIFWEP